MKTALLTLAVSILLTPLYAQEKMTLEACMKYAIEHSTSVQQQEIALEDARQNYIGAVASAMPSINASTGGTMNYGRSIDPETNTYTTTSTFNNSYSLSGSLTVFNGLSTINTIKATKVMRAMGIEELQLARDQIAMNTMSAYFDVVYYYGTVEIAQEQLRTSQLELKQVQEQYELDLKAPADVAEVEAQVANYDYLLTEQQSNLELALIELRKVMNYPQEEPLEIDTEVDIEGMLITETLEEVLNYALVYNPQIRSKEMNSRYYELNYASTKGRYLPSISLSGGFSTNYFVNVDSPGNYAKYFNQLGNNRGYYVGMSMSIPIFSGLSRRVAKHRAKLQYDNAILAHTEQRRTLESEVAKTYQEMQNFGKQYIMSQKKYRQTIWLTAACHKNLRREWLQPLIYRPHQTICYKLAPICFMRGCNTSSNVAWWAITMGFR